MEEIKLGYIKEALQKHSDMIVRITCSLGKTGIKDIVIPETYVSLTPDLLTGCEALASIKVLNIPVSLEFLQALLNSGIYTKWFYATYNEETNKYEYETITLTISRSSYDNLKKATDPVRDLLYEVHSDYLRAMGFLQTPEAIATLKSIALELASLRPSEVPIKQACLQTMISPTRLTVVLGLNSTIIWLFAVLYG